LDKITFKNEIKNILNNYRREELEPTPLMAAVILPLFIKDGEVKVLLTKRVQNLNSHGGEVSFPGGIMEPHDGSLKETALREAEEELGIDRECFEIIGTLDDEISKGGHRVTPFVAFGSSGSEVNFSKDEVADIYCVSINHFADNANYWIENWVHTGVVRQVHFYRYKDDIIWGLTGRMISKFINLVGSAI